jgi:RNA polymerase sigma-70 factor (ECF subfamily)
VFREERCRLLATLVRQLGDLDLAEEVASDAVASALQHWPFDGVPNRPAAWLPTVARRAVDPLRRDRACAARLALLQVEADRAEPAELTPKTVTCPTSGRGCSSPAAIPRCRSRRRRR